MSGWMYRTGLRTAATATATARATVETQTDKRTNRQMDGWTDIKIDCYPYDRMQSKTLCCRYSLHLFSSVGMRCTTVRDRFLERMYGHSQLNPAGT